MTKYLIKDIKTVEDNRINILIEEGMIKKVSTSLKDVKDAKILTFDKDVYVSAGWIDGHTHCFNKYELYSDDCDQIGYRSGVTTVIDAGTAGANTMEEFYQSVKDKKTRVYSLINIAKTGISAQNELSNLENLDINLVKETCSQYPAFIVGIKARMSKSVVGDSGDKPLDIALQIANETKLPLMVHIGTAPSLLQTVMEKVRKKDIITHIFNPKVNGIINEQGNIKDCVYQAMEKGVYFDLGHGSESFSFTTMDKAFSNNVKLDMISTDIYCRNRKNGPVYDLATTMTKVWHNGFSLQQTIDAVTKVPAKIFNLKDLGSLEEGRIGDLTFFKIIEQEKEVVDSTKKTQKVNAYIQPIAVIVKNQYFTL